MCWLGQPRLSCMSATYRNHESRRKILETISWSFSALCNSDSFAASFTEILHVRVWWLSSGFYTTNQKLYYHTFRTNTLKKTQSWHTGKIPKSTANPSWQVVVSIRLMILGGGRLMPSTRRIGGSWAGKGFVALSWDALKESKGTRITSELWWTQRVLRKKKVLSFQKITDVLIQIVLWSVRKSSHGLRGFFSKQMCCYYCRALAWVYERDNPESVELLYTNFGRSAAHRNTRLAEIVLYLFFVYVQFLFEANSIILTIHQNSL